MAQRQNPFVQIFEQEHKRLLKTANLWQWQFYYTSKNFTCSQEEDGSVVIKKGIKLNCKFLPKAFYRDREGQMRQYYNIMMIKDVAIDTARAQQGYFTGFVAYLLEHYEVVMIECVQAQWLRERLEKSALWLDQKYGNFLLPRPPHFSARHFKLFDVQECCCVCGDLIRVQQQRSLFCLGTQQPYCNELCYASHVQQMK
jgi:hypothetical protein